MSDELKACPFCRAQHVTVLQAATSFFSMCQECEARGDYYDTRADAIAAWNRRVVTREQLEKMARELAGGRATAEDTCEARFNAFAMLRAAGFEVADG